MKRALALLAALMTARGSGAEVRVYLASYARAPEGAGIYLAHLDVDTGRLSAPRRAAALPDPSFLAISPDGKFVYAATDLDGGALAAFRVDGAKLTRLNVRTFGPGGCCHVSLDAAGRHVFGASYGSGAIVAFPIQRDGSLGERTGFAQFTGSGPNPERQKQPYAHSIYGDESGRFVYACDLGTDRVWTFQLDPESGALVPTDPPAGETPPGSGPRHLAWSPDGKFAYVNGEMSLEVTAFAHRADRAGLTALQTISSLPPGTPREGNSSAEIVCHPGGKWLYVSNRGHDSLTVFAIAEDGRLSWVDNGPCRVRFPRSFALDPTGKWLIAAGQNDDRIAVLKIDPTTGKLTPTDQSAQVGSPMCVLFGPTP